MKPNNCNFMGRLTQDPELKYTQNGLAICNLSVACSESYIGKDGSVKESTVFPKFTSFGKIAERVSQLKKGEQVNIASTYSVKVQELEGGKKNYFHSFIIRDIARISFLKNLEDASIQNGAQPSGGNFTPDDIPF